MGSTGGVTLPPGLEILTHPAVLLAAGLMYLVEFFVDKIPGVDTGWDAMQTFVRIPAGALLAASAAGGLEMGAAAELVGLLVGGGLAASTHATKAGSRVLINTSPEPVSNWTASVSEDVAVIAGLWTALSHPWLFVGLLALFVLLMIWLLPKLWRGIRALLQRMRNWWTREGGQDVTRGE
jgi:hypothetical protein